MGMTFAFADAALANTRQKNDPWNGAAAGCAIGLLAGARGADCSSSLARSIHSHSVLQENQYPLQPERAPHSPHSLAHSMPQEGSS